MGWQSDGVIGSMQRQSWTAQLAQLAGREQSLPLISEPGCRSPLKAPLATGIRLSGEPAALPAASFSCAPLQPGISLPAQNLSISAAKTFNALFTTPETQGDVFYSKLYPHILPPNTTQLQAAIRQKPKFISVEMGANDILDARSGIAIPGVTITPFAVWSAQYTQLVDEVAAKVPRGLLVSMIDDAATFPSFRRGAEIWADRGAMLVAFHVNVLGDCNGSQNLLFVPARVPGAIAAGLTSRARASPSRSWPSSRHVPSSTSSSRGSRIMRQASSSNRIA